MLIKLLQINIYQLHWLDCQMNQHLHFASLKPLSSIILLPSWFTSGTVNSLLVGFSLSPLIGITECSKISSRNEVLSENKTYIFINDNSKSYIIINS